MEPQHGAGTGHCAGNATSSKGEARHSHALAIAHFLRGRYDEAAHAARRAVQSIPSSSVRRSVLAAALAKLGRIEEAKAVALQVLAMDPSFSAARYCAATGLPTPLAEPMTDAWTTAGLPP